jgi:hypothetical protein
MRGSWAVGVGLALGWLTAGASAQDYSWRPGGAASSVPAAVSLGRPQAMDGAPSNPTPTITATAYQPGIASLPPLGVRAQAPDPVPLAPANVPVIGAPMALPMLPPTPPPAPYPVTVTASAPPPAPPPDPIYGVVPAPPPTPVNPVPGRGGSGAGLFGYDWLGCTTGCGRSLFESDHCFDYMVEPMTNPFLFLDPRSLTEIRPIFIYQHPPDSNPFYHGGSIDFLGFQAKLAVTERLSFIVNKFGLIWNEPRNGMGVIDRHVGATELWLTPQYTFWRDDRSGTIAAAGVIFQIPSGPEKVFQDTGTLTVVPYITIAQRFLCEFNAMTTFGYALSDSHRAEYFYNSYHLDWDVGGLHMFYPFLELNWFHYDAAGNSRPFGGFEGRDLINFGSHAVSGANSLTLAFGSRYKFNPHMETGLALEFPLIGSKDLNNFRLTVDFILRY